MNFTVPIFTEKTKISRICLEMASLGCKRKCRKSFMKKQSAYLKEQTFMPKMQGNIPLKIFLKI